MSDSPNPETPEVDDLLRRAGAGDRDAAADLLQRHRDRLKRMVEARLDRRLRARVGVSDVMQDVALEATRRLPNYAEERGMPFFLWLRFLTAQHLAKLFQRHVGTHRRDVRREAGGLSQFAPSSPDGLAAGLAADQTSPTQAVNRREQSERLERALEQLDPIDREVLSLRHYEQLSNGEVARELGLETSAASKRYLRALKRLGDLMGVGKRSQLSDG